MSTKIIFPYQFKIIKNTQIADPVIYLDVFTRFGSRKIGFLVDSGSDAFVRSNIIPLLGRLDIWDKFNWIFDNQKKQVIFERI